MSPRGVLRLAVDVSLTGSLLFLLSYPMTRGLLRHGVVGCCFLALLAAHHALNAGWYRALPRGRWHARRALGAAADAALMAATLALIASSLAMAGEVFACMPFPMPWWGRDLHHAATAWVYVLAAFHLGLHGAGVWGALRRAAGRAWPALTLAALVPCAWAFGESGFLDGMLLTGGPAALPESPATFLMRLLAAGCFPCMLARLAVGMSGKRR